MFTIAFTGFFTGLALIVAIGAQNAFVLRQGIRGEQVLPIILTCLASDVVAIAAGVGGLGAVISRWPDALPVAQVLGGLYLTAFGIHAGLRAWRPTSMTTESGPAMGPRTAVLTALALTWLNPHFYLDTVVLLGTVANSFGVNRWWFLLGAVVASTTWFFALGYGSRLLRRFFAKPSSWRFLDGGIALVMGALGVTLLTH